MKRILMALVCLMILTACAPAKASETMTLFAVNVGKADALVLTCGSAAYLIDTGSAESWGQLSCALKMLGITHLDGVIVTHADKDHAGGAPMLAASSIEVDAWYASKYFVDVKESKHPVLLAARSRGQTVTWLSDGDALPFDCGALTVLAPALPFDDENACSLVLLAESDSGRMLLMGDAVLEAERSLLEHHPELPRCQVLKVGHHGGGDATSGTLTALVKPQIAVISTDTQARDDTPAPGVLKRLLKAGAEIFITQDCGAGVLVTLDSGQASARLTDWTALPEPLAGVHLADKDDQHDTLRIVNDSALPADLSGWYIVSERGGETYVFPEGAMLSPGGSLTLGTQSTGFPTDLIWPDRNVWHDAKRDAARLYDVYGREMDTLN